MAYTTELLPGDVLAVRTDGWAAGLIRFGAGIAGKPNLDNHVVIFHHYASNGVPWGLEGRPGGVGWKDMRDYINSRYTVNNCGQPGRSDADRADVAKKAISMDGTKYDWEAIGGDALADLHVHLWNLSFPHGRAPGEVVCSSFAAYAYGVKNWPHPDLGSERYCQPGDWTTFCLEGGYSRELLPVR